MMKNISRGNNKSNSRNIWPDGTTMVPRLFWGLPKPPDSSDVISVMLLTRDTENPFDPDDSTMAPGPLWFFSGPAGVFQ